MKVRFENKLYNFPDDATEDEISDALSLLTIAVKNEPVEKTDFSDAIDGLDKYSLDTPVVHHTVDNNNHELDTFVITVIAFIALIFFLRKKIIGFFKNMIMKIKSIPLNYISYVAISALLATGYYFAFAERTYEDCILNHVKSTGNEDAVIAIKKACKCKYYWNYLCRP